jgi:hypothetical protein
MRRSFGLGFLDVYPLLFRPCFTELAIQCQRILSRWA